MLSTLAGHTDICMSLCILKKLNYLASASLDTTISVWDSYTNDRLLHLQGHKKGILDLTYSPEYRLLVSCGFEHDALVWSPFVKNLVYRLKGHHSALCAVKCVENSPELITADVSGVFKLWDVRKFDCVQTFSANLSGTETKDNSRLCCFEYCTLRARDAMQKEDDSRIYAASKQILSFDQERVVHAATSDKTTIIQIFWVAASVSFITISDYNVIVWDALIGSKTVVNERMNGDVEITAACLDDRKRKMVVGGADGHITVYNHLNGQMMKTSSGRRNPTAVVSLVYICETIRFIAGYENGLIRVFDENALEDCNVLRTFDPFKMHPELLCLHYDESLDTLLTVGSTDGIIRLWDYSAAKCEYEHVVGGDYGTVVFASFLDPLPIVVTSDSLCNIVLWGSRGSGFKGTGRICGFMNQTPEMAELEPHIRTEGQEEARPRRALAQPVNQNIKDAERVIMAAPVPDVHQYKNEKPNTQSLEESTGKAEELIAKANEKWGKSTAAQSIAWDARSCTLYTCDDLGYLRCFNIKKVIADIGMTEEVATAAGGDDDNEEKDDDGGEAKSSASHNDDDISVLSTLLVEEVPGAPGADGLVAPPRGGVGKKIKDEEEEYGNIVGRRFVKGICRRLTRTNTSALPPAPIPPSIDKDYSGTRVKRTDYAVSEPNNAAAYQGVDFLWGVQAHGNRISTCVVTPQGCLTSGADLMVRMWSQDGLPLGVLLQSVPIGRRSQTWDLLLDAKGIMESEDAELDEIIEEVQELAAAEDKPDIYTMDFTSMEPGAGAEEFTRSELRQRIDETSNKLGIHFPTEGEEITKHTGEFDPDDPDIGSVDAAIANKVKTLDNALAELRSYHTASEFTPKGPDKTEMQEKMQAKKYREISKKFAKKGGMLMGPPGSDSGVINHDIDMNDIVEPGKEKEQEDENDLGPKTAAGEPHTERDGGDSSVDDGKGTAANSSFAEPSIGSVDFNDLASLASSLGLPSSVKHVGKSLQSSIDKASSSGERTIAIKKKCDQYSNWAALERALDSDDPSKKYK